MLDLLKSLDRILKEHIEETSLNRELMHTFHVMKNATQLKRGLVFGIVYEPDKVDSHGDFTDALEIERAAHDFLPRAMINLEHADNHPDVEVVESYIARSGFVLDGSEERVRKGSWVLVTRVNDMNLRKKIEDGEYTGYSLEGYANVARAA